MKIIYQTDDNGVAVITPAPNCPHPIEAIARKDVPAGKPYKIVEDSYVPTDRTFRNAWEVDAAELTDGVGSESNEFEV
tara:strand:- start:1732 stop:1965 length:234 start_codon:yes stop_codon:yes gene_type:complete